MLYNHSLSDEAAAIGINALTARLPLFILMRTPQASLQDPLWLNTEGKATA